MEITHNTKIAIAMGIIFVCSLGLFLILPVWLDVVSRKQSAYIEIGAGVKKIYDNESNKIIYLSPHGIAVTDR